MENAQDALQIIVVQTLPKLYFSSFTARTWESINRISELDENDFLDPEKFYGIQMARGERCCLLLIKQIRLFQTNNMSHNCRR